MSKPPCASVPPATPSPPVPPPPGTLICTLAELPGSGGRVFSFGEGQQTFRIIVLAHNGQIQAWHNCCPHFGAPLAEKDEWLILKPGNSFSCNVHYARFRWDDGVCEAGDCEGDQLAGIAIKIRDGQVFFG
ncbi:MAG: Rieske 2Fe-2S domain-containing protein [Zoogloeaceae bacterium]|nr:Rieske 2Fe-2S domain-containing protein [Zoogloeaceae bacterium]